MMTEKWEGVRKEGKKHMRDKDRENSEWNAKEETICWHEGAYLMISIFCDYIVFYIYDGHTITI